MFAVASIFHAQPAVGLDHLFETLKSDGFSISKRTWRGFNTAIEQIRFAPPSTDVVVQSEDEDFTQVDLEELAPLLPAAVRDRFKQCCAEFSILPFLENGSEEQYKAWLESGVWA